MSKTGGAFDQPLTVKHLRGLLRLAIRCKREMPSSGSMGSMAIILNSSRFDGRIDCIDWEPLFIAVDGNRYKGFHKHAWDAKSMSCER